MKKVFTVLCLFILQKGTAQVTFNAAYHNVNEKPNPFLVQLSGDLFFTSTCYEAYDYGKSYLYKYNSAGALKFRSSALTGYVPAIGFPTNDNSLLIAGKNAICDVQGNTQVNFVSKIDTAGNASFVSTYTVPAFDDFKTALQYIDSSYFIFTDSVLFKYSKTGAFITKINTGLTTISSCLRLANNNILLSAKQGTTVSLVEMNSAASVVASGTCSSLFSKMRFYGSQGIIGLGTNNKLYKISPALNTIASSALNNLIDFALMNDTLYALSPQQYSVIDTSFNTVYTHSLSSQNMSYSNIIMNGQNPALLGTGKATNSFVGFGSHNYLSLNQINKFSGPLFNSDVTLLSVVADSIYASYPTAGNFNTYLRAKVTIQNSGSSTLNNFKLNCYRYPLVSCGSVFYQELFSGLNVAPGASVTVTTGTFVHKAFYTAPTPSVTYCFYSTVPNNETDNVFAGNELCQSFAVPVGIKSNSMQTGNILLSPNPFNGEIKLEAPVELAGVEIYDTFGKLVLTDDSKTGTLNTNSLSPGIYFLKIKTESGSYIKKAVKE